MITAIVTFKLPSSIDAARARELYEASAPRYRDLRGLVRKYYLLDEENRIGGGVYLWQSRSFADALYTPEWMAWAADRYGARPEIRYFETPLVVDNASPTVSEAAA
jgi:hypothetical protein